jgi:hypothetical protein
MSKLNSRPPLPIAQKKVMFKLEADDKNKLLSAAYIRVRLREEFKLSISTEKVILNSKVEASEKEERLWGQGNQKSFDP